MSTAITAKPTFLATTAQAFSPLMPKLALLLPQDIPLETFKAAIMLYLSEHQDALRECSPQSLRECALKSGMQGLLPGRDCHWLPFSDKRKGPLKQATFVPTYEGIILALERTGKVRKAFAQAVYSRDVFVIDYLADTFSHQPVLSAERGTLTCFYGCIVLQDGTKHVQVMSLAEIDAIKAKAPAHDTGPWSTHYVAMGRKTALKQAAKYVQLTPQITQMLDDDDERERLDQSPARIQGLITEMWGDEPTPNAIGQISPENAPNFSPGVSTPSLQRKNATTGMLGGKKADTQHHVSRQSAPKPQEPLLDDGDAPIVVEPVVTEEAMNEDGTLNF